MSLDKRCVGVITLAGVGEYGQADLDFLDGIGMAHVTGPELRRALSCGFDGWIDDDFMVPHSHSRWLASKIRTAEMKFIPESGHISLIVKNRDKIVTELQHLFP